MQLQRQTPRRERLGYMYGGGRYTVVATIVDDYMGHLTIMGYVVRTRQGLRRCMLA